jgi:hypothetical protein
MTTEPAFLLPEPELVEAIRAGVELHRIAIGRRLPDSEIEHDCLQYVEASIQAEKDHASER